MCKCNQGGSRVDKVGIAMLNMARKHLVLARKRKQAAEVTRDHAENGGPDWLLGHARKDEIKALNERQQARAILRDLEIRCNGAHVKSLAISYVSASELNGWRFQTWEFYRNIFADNRDCPTDIWQ